MIEILVLSIIQGVTEFLPVSSSSHLILTSRYLEFQNQSLSIDVSLHIGSFLAVLFYFRFEVFNFIKNKELFFKIFLSSLPVMIVGYFLIKLDLIDHLAKKSDLKLLRDAEIESYQNNFWIVCYKDISIDGCNVSTPLKNKDYKVIEEVNFYLVDIKLVKLI